jgi:hypothetical protein
VLLGLERHSDGSKVFEKIWPQGTAHYDAPYPEAELYAIGAHVDGDKGNVPARIQKQLWSSETTAFQTPVIRKSLSR